MIRFRVEIKIDDDEEEEAFGSCKGARLKVFLLLNYHQQMSSIYS